jgi:acetylornithine deacetylase/succinyl-diaminopimelate desuccinylase-like protein
MNSEWTITSPYTPIIKDNKLYGRGVARGGSLFMILGIIKAM